MKKSIFITAFLIFSTSVFSQTASATYTAGDIPTTYSTSANISTSSVATEPGTLTVTIPTGNTTITSVDVAYQMTATNGAYMAEQRSFIKCISTGGTSEADVYSGVGNSEGTYSYSRSNLDIANNVTNGGDIVFELHAFRTYFDDGSNTTHQYVNNNSWSVTVNYNYVAPPANPTNPTTFAQTSKGCSQIALTWTKDTNNDNVMIAVNFSNTFGIPIDGTSYNVGTSITGGGTLFYTGDSEYFNHDNLEAQTTYYYKIWSVSSENYYSTGVEGNAKTRSNPKVSNVRFTITDGIVDVYYDVTDGEKSTVTITIAVSDDGGNTYNFLCTQVTGDIGANISTGTNKHIIWDFEREHSGVMGNNFRIKIFADDLYGDQIYYAGKIYNTITIGSQVWLKENLNVGTKMINDASHTGTQQTANNIIEKYCYNNEEDSCTIYGGLYEWGEAVQYKNGASNTTSPSPLFSGNVQGICPNGWHIPTYGEMLTLQNYVGNQATKLVDENAKSGYTYTNETGFSALFAGYRRADYGIFGGLNYASFRSSTENSSDGAYYMSLGFSSSDVNLSNGNKNLGFSVRCLKD